MNSDHKATSLLPCPFCGGVPSVDSLIGIGNILIECRNEDCPVTCTVFGDTWDDALNAWNRRAALDTPPAVQVPETHDMNR